MSENVAVLALATMKHVGESDRNNSARPSEACDESADKSGHVIAVDRRDLSGQDLPSSLVRRPNELDGLGIPRIPRMVQDEIVDRKVLVPVRLGRQPLDDLLSEMADGIIRLRRKNVALDDAYGLRRSFVWKR